MDRIAPGADATHAWVEAFLPQVGWVGFDPTNNLLAHDRYIRTALGRDYADVPPTRGIYRGSKESELYVAVKVSKYVDMPPLDATCRFRKTGLFWWKERRNLRRRPRSCSICNR